MKLEPIKLLPFKFRLKLKFLEVKYRFDGMDLIYKYRTWYKLWLVLKKQFNGND